MPRISTKEYSESDVLNALADIAKNNTSLRKAAIRYDIPKSTLALRRKYKDEIDGYIEKDKMTAVQIVNKLVDRYGMSTGLTRRDIDRYEEGREEMYHKNVEILDQAPIADILQNNASKRGYTFFKLLQKYSVVDDTAEFDLDNVSDDDEVADGTDDDDAEEVEIEIDLFQFRHKKRRKSNQQPKPLSSSPATGIQCMKRTPKFASTPIDHAKAPFVHNIFNKQQNMKNFENKQVPDVSKQTMCVTQVVQAKSQANFQKEFFIKFFNQQKANGAVTKPDTSKIFDVVQLPNSTDPKPKDKVEIMTSPRVNSIPDTQPDCVVIIDEDDFKRNEMTKIIRPPRYSSTPLVSLKSLHVDNTKNATKNLDKTQTNPMETDKLPKPVEVILDIDLDGIDGKSNDDELIKTKSTISTETQQQPTKAQQYDHEQYDHDKYIENMPNKKVIVCNGDGRLIMKKKSMNIHPPRFSSTPIMDSIFHVPRRSEMVEESPRIALTDTECISTETKPTQTKQSPTSDNLTQLREIFGKNSGDLQTTKEHPMTNSTENLNPEQAEETAQELTKVDVNNTTVVQEPVITTDDGISVAPVIPADYLQAFMKRIYEQKKKDDEIKYGQQVAIARSHTASLGQGRHNAAPLADPFKDFLSKQWELKKQLRNQAIDV